jgi:DNA-binding NarL/FixJ family response regulator
MGFVTKSAPKEILFKAVSTVVAGDVYMPEILFRSLSDLREASDEFQTNVDSVTELLTERQLDILQLISKGLSNKLIARELHLSENTIKVHVSAILRALGLNNRTQAGLIGQTLENSKGSQPTETGNL